MSQSTPASTQTDKPNHLDREWPPPAVSPVWVLPCPDLDAAVADLTSVGFMVHSLGPADDPSYAVMVATPGTENTVAIRLDTSAYHGGDRNGYLAVTSEHGLANLDWATGTGAIRVHQDPHEEADLDTSAASTDLVFGAVDTEEWGVGRAGMNYRDLLPGRWAQQFIASHIHIAEGGPVPDYVHFHDIDFQLIFVDRGWVRVVYEDQGEPFILHPGDAILQAPGIRHQVLESSDDLYVIEISSPAEHPTYVEPSLTLPNGSAPGRRYGGQDYVHFVFADAHWVGSGAIKQRSLELEVATDGRYGARVIEASGGTPVRIPNIESSDFTLLVVLDGAMTVFVDGEAETRTLTSGQSVAAGPASLSALQIAPALESPARALLVHRYTSG